MYDTRNLSKSAETRRKEYEAFWNDFEGTLSTQEVEVSFKFGSKYFPEAMWSVASPYICELTNNKIQFIRFNPRSIYVKKKQKVMLSYDSDLVDAIEIGIGRGIDFVFGPFPVEIIYLKITVRFKNEKTYQLYVQCGENTFVANEIVKWCKRNEVGLIDDEDIEKCGIKLESEDV